jgi:hypothetical protein
MSWVFRVANLLRLVVREHVAKYRSDDVTARLNEVYSSEKSAIDPFVRRAQNRSVMSAKRND